MKKLLTTNAGGQTVPDGISFNNGKFSVDPETAGIFKREYLPDGPEPLFPAGMMSGPDTKEGEDTEIPVTANAADGVAPMFHADVVLPKTTNHAAKEDDVKPMLPTGL